MALSPFARRALQQEARALLTRLARVRPFSEILPTVPAAAVTPVAQLAVERYLVGGRRELRRRVDKYLRWLGGAEAVRLGPAEAQRRLAFLRLRFNAVLTQFDIFADALTQRSECENGVWLAGLDYAAADALALPGGELDPPPLMTYLDRGYGAAIRRARTRLPGGGRNPVAIVRIPRERMVGSGIASSLVHEVGHQGAALLGLVKSLRAALRAVQKKAGARARPWKLWERWISEIVADFWSLAKVGVSASLGLMGVVSLPRAFVFRINQDDPHPFPWIRVKLSLASGELLYPSPQWKQLDGLWQSYYPMQGLNTDSLAIVRELEATLPSFVRLLATHRPPALRGKSLSEAFPLAARQPARLRELFRRSNGSPSALRRVAPTLVFAALGQARQDGKLSPEKESRIVGELLRRWALRQTFATASICAPATRRRVRARAA